jgi:hypothetical protein
MATLPSPPFLSPTLKLSFSPDAQKLIRFRPRKREGGSLFFPEDRRAAKKHVGNKRKEKDKRFN